MRFIGVVLLVGGCWGHMSSAPSREPDEVPVETIALTRPSHNDGCKRSAENVRSLLHYAQDQDLATHADAIADVVQRRCAADDWGVELKDCLWKARTLDDLDPCEDVATPGQRQALDDEIELILKN